MRDPCPQATLDTRCRTHPSSITLRPPLHEPFPLTNDARTIRTGRALWSNVNPRAGGPQEAGRPATRFSTLPLVACRHAQAISLRLSATLRPDSPGLAFSFWLGVLLV